MSNPMDLLNQAKDALSGGDTSGLVEKAEELLGDRVTDIPVVGEQLSGLLGHHKAEAASSADSDESDDSEDSDSTEDSGDEEESSSDDNESADSDSESEASDDNDDDDKDSDDK